MSDEVAVMSRPLPCIVCGRQPDPVGGGAGNWQPYAATMFDAGNGHYGSTVWDEMSSTRSLTINVCDECLIANSARVAVFETLPQPRSVRLLPWEPPP